MKNAGFFFFALLLFLCFPVFADETFTLVTYYPAPFGVYQEMLIHGRMAIGDANDDGVIDNDDLPTFLDGTPRPGSLAVYDAIYLGGVKRRVGRFQVAEVGNNLDNMVIFGAGSTTGEALRIRIDGDYWAADEDAMFIEKTDDDKSVEGGMILGFASSGANDTILGGQNWAVNHTPAIVMRLPSTGVQVGIAKTDPQTTLDVNGGVTIANDTRVCGGTGAPAGTMRYNSGQIQYCNGSVWQSVFPSGGPTFITPIQIANNVSNDVWYTYNARSILPSSARVVILEVTITSGSDVSRKQLSLRASPTSPHLIVRTSSFTLTQQVICPLSPSQTFQYSFNGTKSWSGEPSNRIRLIGYY